MGTLTFQATAGGSVNLLGPNISGTVNLTLPSADGTSGQPLQTNGSGTLSFANLAIANGGTGATSFAANQIHYGSFSQSANLTFNGTTLTANTLNLTNALGTAYGGTGLTSFTANGVVYASSTSALATGSAFVFDGTNVGIGTTSPASKLDVRTSAAEIARFSSSSTNGGYQIFYPDNVTTPVYVGSLKAILATGNATDFAIIGSGANNMVFGTNSAERMRIDSSGNVLVTSAAGLGYGTGSGGTVTQATSKSTNVTLNKPTGQITMNNAALLPATQVGFTLNNSLLTINDVVVVNIDGFSGTSDAYNVWAAPITGGTYIFVKNISAGSLSEAIRIHFAIIKGATA
jgi:hypothetical protein